jgi:hypothetical protein
MQTIYKYAAPNGARIVLRNVLAVFPERGVYAASALSCRITLKRAEARAPVVVAGLFRMDTTRLKIAVETAQPEHPRSPF